MSQMGTALITGATGGIGEALCREFARHSHNLVITARNGRRLDEMANRLRRTYQVDVTTIPADFNQPGEAKKLFTEVRDSGIAVDFLVNNAGFGLGGYFIHNGLKIQDAMIRVNVSTPTKLCRMFLPDMLSRGYGKILNVASTGAFVPGPYNSVYCAAKAYILSLSEAIGHELRGSGITVSALCPGAARTGFAHRANMETTRLFNYGTLSPKQVARAAYIGMMHGEKLIVPGCLSRISICAARLLPRCAATCVSGFIQKQFTCR